MSISLQSALANFQQGLNSFYAEPIRPIVVEPVDGLVGRISLLSVQNPVFEFLTNQLEREMSTASSERALLEERNWNELETSIKRASSELPSDPFAAKIQQMEIVEQGFQNLQIEMGQFLIQSEQLKANHCAHLKMVRDIFSELAKSEEATAIESWDRINKSEAEFFEKILNTILERGESSLDLSESALMLDKIHKSLFEHRKGDQDSFERDKRGIEGIFSYAKNLLALTESEETMHHHAARRMIGQWSERIYTQLDQILVSEDGSVNKKPLDARGISVIRDIFKQTEKLMDQLYVCLHQTSNRQSKMSLEITQTYSDGFKKAKEIWQALLKSRLERTQRIQSSFSVLKQDSPPLRPTVQR